MAFWLNEKVDTDQLAGRSARGLCPGLPGPRGQDLWEEEKEAGNLITWVTGRGPQPLLLFS